MRAFLSFILPGSLLRFASLLVVQLLFIMPGVGLAQMGVPGEASGSIAAEAVGAETLETLLHAGAVRGSVLRDPDGLRAFYAGRNGRLLWVTSFGLSTDRAQDVLEILEESWTHGLNPEQYRVSEIRMLLDDFSYDDRFALEVLVSDAVARYGRDLTGMRVDPGAVRQKAKYWRQALGTEEVLKRVSGNSDVRAALTALEPQLRLYESLREELVRLAQLPRGEAQKRVILNGILRPGDGHKKVEDIRERMGVPADSVRLARYYDDTLAAAVMAFQKDHGLDPDGVIGPKTVEQMNITPEEQMFQIIANLERLRWVEHTQPERYVLVNIPSATLWAVENGKVALEMPVIVGKKARPTMSFKAEITGVRFNPNWTVPPTIKRADFLPRLRNDPYALSGYGIEFASGGYTIDPAKVDWQGISWKELNNIRMVQGPGRNNPLGRVRVIMENPYNIYLHDTNKPQYFTKTDRTLSSGCIRVAEPEKLAGFILGRNADWSQEKMDQILSTYRMQDVESDATIPVYILYQTVWRDGQGRIVYGADIYGRDRKLVKTLGASNGYYIPSSPEEVLQSIRNSALASMASSS